MGDPKLEPGTVFPPAAIAAGGLAIGPSLAAVTVGFGGLRVVTPFAAVAGTIAMALLLTVCHEPARRRLGLAQPDAEVCESW